MTPNLRFLQPALLSTLISVLLGPPALMVVMILFGAPLTTHFQHTLLAATHIAFLSVLPLTYVYGVDGQRWKEVISATLPLDEVFGATVGCLTGAWLGAVPIPLDWYVMREPHWSWPCSALLMFLPQGPRVAKVASDNRYWRVLRVCAREAGGWLCCQGKENGFRVTSLNHMAYFHGLHLSSGLKGIGNGQAEVVSRPPKESASLIWFG